MWQKLDRWFWQSRRRVARRRMEWDFAARLMMTSLVRYSCLSQGAEQEGRRDQRARLGWGR